MNRIQEFSVVDLETTGFSSKSHRIVEIAIIHVSRSGEVTDSFTSIFNPGRDLGPTHVHGLAGKDVQDAPKFEEVAGTIADFLRGTIPVAHNAPFDKRFLSAEFERLGVELDDIPWLCTLKLCSQMCGGLKSRKLKDCCDYFEISLANAHEALADAQATAHLFSELLALDEDLSVIESHIHDLYLCPFDIWPTGLKKGGGLKRVEATQNEDPCFIRRLVEALPAGGFEEPAEQQYLEVLDRVLEDRRVTIDELQELLELAFSLGLTKSQVESMHLKYMEDLLKLAWADNVITEFEASDLATVRELLDISEGDFTEASERIRNLVITSEGAEDTPGKLLGKSVCFTGTFQNEISGRRVTKEDLYQMAEEAGMLVKKGVTKKLDYLVAADPDSLSGKAKKARDYGIPILAEAAFWQIVERG